MERALSQNEKKESDDIQPPNASQEMTSELIDN
jgi:hypothetical protein